MEVGGGFKAVGAAGQHRAGDAGVRQVSKAGVCAEFWEAHGWVAAACRQS